MNPAAAALPPAEWQRLNRLLEQALTLDDRARSAWVAGLKDEPESVLAVLRELLDGQDERSRHDDPPTGSTVRRLIEIAIPQADREGDLIGPYRLLQVLGQGGMSTVWAAERVEGGVKRRVALKIPHAEWSDRGLAERLARECQVLAELNHPNIAHLYDAGTARTGRPYLALELVDGVPIDQSCAARALDTRARVRLFLEVLSAVAYAHARLVIHRDLKPGNVLVTAAGQVKLLDFGIAKMLASATSAAEETELTRLSGRPLTLAYAAPEQVQGKSITTATDIYSLGALLYELLTCVRPVQANADSRAAMEAAILSGRPPLPSTAARAPAAARALRGDLDAILMKALSLAPEARYPTADAFADDLERYLDGRGVRARLASRRYRVERFLARNRLAVGTVAAVSAALLVGLGMAVWQAREASHQARVAAVERDRALAALEHQEAVDSFLSDLLQEAGRAGKPVLVPELIERAAAMAEREFADAPDALAAVLKTVGDFKINADGIEPALQVFDHAAALTRDSGDAGLRTSIQCTQAALRGVSGQLAESRKALAQLATGAETTPFVAAECYSMLAQMEIYAGNGAAAEGASARALQAWDRSPRGSPRQHAALLLLEAQAKALNGETLVAESRYRQVLDELHRLGRDRGEWGDTARLALIESAGERGDILSALTQVDEALRMVSTDLPGSAPPTFLLEMRAGVLADLGRFEDALRHDQQILQLSQGTDVAMHTRALLGGACALAQLGRTAEAQQWWREAQASQGDPGGAASSGIRAQRALACIRLRQQDPAAAAQALDSALAVPDTPISLSLKLHLMRAQAALAAHQAEQALRHADTAQQMADRLRGDHGYSRWSAEAAFLRAQSLQLHGRSAEARGLYREAATQWSGSLGPEHAWTRLALQDARTLPAPASLGTGLPTTSIDKDTSS